VIAERLTTRSFRNLADSAVGLGAGITVVHGANGAGKTNLLEALYFALTGHSCRTRREREMIRFGERLARAEADLAPGPGQPEGAASASEPVTMLASVSVAEGRNRRVDGRPAGPDDDLRRPPVSVFMPDRLALVKGPPTPRRAHLDRLVAALWPARSTARSDYARALGQRNALLSRAKRGGAAPALGAWDRELAERALPLVAARREAATLLSEPFREAAAELGLEEDAELAYRPRTGDAGIDAIVAELAERRDSDLARGFTGWGPHLDDVVLRRGKRPLRRYGSQGQQRIGLLALLFAERQALRQAGRTLPLMLLDDVMSELDRERRGRLVAMLAGGGQAMITATESEHVPDARDARRLAIASGRIGE
jgi:DNA replication and repair protein RecF